MLRRAVVALFTVSLGWGSLAQAQQNAPSDADALITHGVDLRQHGQDEAALAEFRRAFEVGRSPRARAQIALAEQALGRWADAHTDLTAALAEASDAWITRNRSVLESALATIRVHLASLMVTTNAPSGELWVNGQRVGSLPLSENVHVESGTAAIEVRAPGFATARRSVDLAAGSTHLERLYNEPAASEAPASTGPRAATMLGAAPGASETGSQPTSTLHGVGIDVAIAGGVLLIGGIAAQAVWQTRVALYNDDSQCFYGGVARSVRCGGVLGDANTAVATMVALYAIGGAAVVVGGIMALVVPSHPASSSHARVSCGPGPGSFGLSCAAAF